MALSRWYAADWAALRHSSAAGLSVLALRLRLATFNAPHTAIELAEENWTHPYSRKLAAYPLPSLRAQKYWAPVGRVDNVHGDRNLFCSCVPVSDFAEG